MIISEIKQIIEQQTGVPASFLTGETAEENIAQAKALLAYKREVAEKRPKSTVEEFGEWFNGQIDDQNGVPNGAKDQASEALANLENALKAEGSNYPITKDNGEVMNRSDERPLHDQFKEWLDGKLGYNQNESDWKQ